MEYAKYLCISDYLIIMYHINSSLINEISNREIITSCSGFRKCINVSGKQVADYKLHAICLAAEVMFRDLEVVVSKDKGFEVYKKVNNLNFKIVSTLKSLKRTRVVMPKYKNLDILFEMDTIDIFREWNSINNYIINRDTLESFNKYREYLLNSILDNINLSNKEVRKLNNIFNK